MMKLKKKNRIIIAVIIVIISAVITAGYFYFRSEDSATNSNQKTSDETSITETKDNTNAETNTSEVDEQTSPSLKTYTNEKYGFAFQYPEEWLVEAGPIEHNSSASSYDNTEYVVNLTRNVEDKYNTTLSIKISDRTFLESEVYYDDFLMSGNDSISKTKYTTQFGDAICYQNTAKLSDGSTDESKDCLVPLKNKAMFFETFTNKRNIEDPNYVANVDTVFESLKISSVN